MTNRFFDATFNPPVGSTAKSGPVRSNFDAVETAFDAVQTEIDRLGGGITGLAGFPASFATAGLKYLRVNAAENSIEFVSSGRVVLKTIAGTSYTLVAADAGALLLFTNGSPVTVTVPDAVFAQGDVVCLRQKGAGQVTMSPGAGVTLTSSGGLLSTRGQHAQIAVIFDAANDAAVIGDRNGTLQQLASLNGGNAFTGAQTVAFQALTDAASIAVDASLSNHFRVVLGGNRTLANPTNLRDGGVYNFWVKQDGTGSRTLAYGSLYKWPSGSAPTLTTSINALDLVIAQYNATDNIMACSITKDIR
jgi:hypothetical protein